MPRTPADPVARRQRQLAVAGLLMGLALVARVVYFKTVLAPHFRELSDKMRKQAYIKPTGRGDVLDRNGRTVARTKVIRVCVFNPTIPRSAHSDRMHENGAAAAELLEAVLAVPRETILRRMYGELGEGDYAARRRIKIGLTTEEADAVQYLKRQRAFRNILARFDVAEDEEREYPGGDACATILGKVIPAPFGMLRGIGGLEDWADPILSGSPGWYTGRVDAAQRVNPLMPLRDAAPVQGMNLQLTIDTIIQQICAEELDRCMQEKTPVGATAIVLDPYTGEVLAMVSRSGKQPAAPKGAAQGDGPPEASYNRALMPYEPGSVMKPITVALGLEWRVVRPVESIPCESNWIPHKRRVRCEAHRSSLPAPGTNTPRMIVAKSCNVATGKIAIRLGPRRLHEGLGRFGLLSRTGIELPGDVGGYSLSDPAQIASRGAGWKDDIARVGFGQGVAVTPLAMAAAFGVFANQGLLVRPRILRSYGYPGSRPVHVYERPEPERVISPATASAMREYLRAVVQIGTGKNAAIPGYTTGGKTGTAMKVKHGRYDGYIASFIGLVPVTKPRAVIAVVVDEPHGGYHGSQAAAPTWGRIAARLMAYWHVPPELSAKDAPQGERRGQSGQAPIGD